MNRTATLIMLLSLLAFSFACKKDQSAQADSTTAVNTTTTTTGEETAAPATPAEAKTLEEQAVETYANARRLSEKTQGGFVNNPTSVHERVAGRIVKRINDAAKLTEPQQQQLLDLVKTYPESAIKGSAGQAKRHEIMKRAYQEILTEEQRASLSTLTFE